MSVKGFIYGLVSLFVAVGVAIVLGWAMSYLGGVESVTVKATGEKLTGAELFWVRSLLGLFLYGVISGLFTLFNAFNFGYALGTKQI